MSVKIPYKMEGQSTGIFQRENEVRAQKSEKLKCAKVRCIDKSKYSLIYAVTTSFKKYHQSIFRYCPVIL